MTALSIQNLSRIFQHGKKKFHALKDVSFDIKKGEIFGLLGPNGAGKTTLLNILSTILTPTEGTAKVFGFDVVKQKDEVRKIMNSGSYESDFHWSLGVNDILTIFGKFYGLDGHKLEKRINFLAEKFEIKDILNHKYVWLSSGQRMRMILCKALINNPRFVMFDEPTVNLDPNLADKTRKTILEINKDFGTTILLTTHMMFEVEELCDRIAFIDNGRIMDAGKVNKIKSKYPSLEDYFRKMVGKK